MSTDVLDASIVSMRQGRAYRHSLLERLRSEPMDREGACSFALQWYKAATAHKRAFPGLIYNTPDDRVRLQLIEILREEYGFGEVTRIHARILLRFLTALGLDAEVAAKTTTAPEIAEFARKVDLAWTHGDSVVAFGVHFALEFLAANMHKSFYAGVQTLGLLPADIEYFQIHSVAEDEHALLAEEGLQYLAKDPTNELRLFEGVKLGTELVATLLDGLERAYSGELH